MSSETRRVDLGSLTLRDDGVLHVVFDTEELPTQAMAVEYLDARRELIGDSQVPVVMEVVNIPYTERGLRAFFMSSLPAPKCRAVVVNDPTMERMFKTFQRFDSPEVPTRLFHNFGSAIDWAKTVE